MIPVSLRLESFLSYAEADVDFTSDGVVCLTGANGQGKSALLCAMTWALWGCARGSEGGQNQEGLIREGADRARVELTFELNDATYRVARSRTRTGRADLQLLVRSGEGWTNLAGESLSETQRSIAHLVRMDYKTFVASAFLLQGRADDFLTRLKPDERKDVFARLLDLGTYERLAEEARSRARVAEGRRKERAARVETLVADCSELGPVEAALREAAAQTETAGRAAEGAEKELEARRTELGRLEKIAALAAQERHAVAELAERVEADALRLASKEKELVELDELLARRDEVGQALEELSNLGHQNAALREAAVRAGELETERTRLAGAVEAERAGIDSRRQQRAAAMRTIGADLQGLEKDAARLAEVEEMLAESEGVTASLTEVRARLEALLKDDGSTKVLLAGLEALEHERQEKLTLLSGKGGRCPLCDGQLDAVHRRRIVRALEAEGSSRAAERLSHESRLAVVSKEGKLAREEEKRLESVLAQREKVALKAAELRARTKGGPELRRRRDTLVADDEADERLLASGRFAAALLKDLRRAEKEMEKVAYDRDAHQRLRERLEGLSGYRALAGRLEEAAGRRERVVGEGRELADRLDEERASVAGREKALGELNEVLRAEPSVRDRVAAARAELDEARARAAVAAGERARLTARRESLLALRKELDEARGAEQGAADERRLYERLSKAFGRGGIPDLIIENALPELTADANEVLGRLSDYEMSLSFAMEKATKSGQQRETFDVRVHHDGGVRDYQMFSGGEAFRIAFAIRLGLSKLLVRRAGARLETLVIDEGFGTQDAQGRERLVEAVNLARREFRKVLVITHLDELKDAFGAQIRVGKDPVKGSQVYPMAG